MPTFGIVEIDWLRCQTIPGTVPNVKICQSMTGSYCEFLCDCILVTRAESGLHIAENGAGISIYNNY